MSAPFYVILNPAADRGGAERSWGRARSELERSGAAFELVRTTRGGEATELAAAASRGVWRAVVAVGGDGTVQEVANGLLRGSAVGEGPPLGVIAVGSGNDFVKLLGLPRDRPRAAVRHLLEGTVRQVDVGRVGDRYFTNGVGIGFDARVAVEARKIQRLRGLAIYAWALVKVLRRHSTPWMRVELDGVVVADRELTLVTVGNGACHGGGFWICPGALIDDGLLEVCIADALSVRRLLPLLPRVMRGTHVGHPAVEMHAARTIRITSREPVAVHADGEILSEGTTSLEMEILPGRLAVLA
jgi:diacylglycerol kinase (ATP)